MWAEELPLALWAYRTTHKTATGHTPFALTYGSEAVLPIELKLHSHRVTYFDPRTNQDLLLGSLDLLEEKRNEAEVRAAAQQLRVARYYNSRVRQKDLNIGDLVLKRVFPPPTGLSPRWEGPYVIQRKLINGTFKLATVDGAELPRAWNSEHIHRSFT